jgi:predicted nucleotidyltransferase
MRMRDQIIQVLREAKPMLDSHGVAYLAYLRLFGSFARDEGSEDSDVDLLVEFSRPIGLFDFVRLHENSAPRLDERSSS